MPHLAEVDMATRGRTLTPSNTGHARVVTYALAYQLDKRVSLCARHKTDRYGILGPVQHGLYWGWCRGCDDERRQEG